MHQPLKKVIASPTTQVGTSILSVAQTKELKEAQEDSSKSQNATYFSRKRKNRKAQLICLHTWKELVRHVQDVT